MLRKPRHSALRRKFSTGKKKSLCCNPLLRSNKMLRCTG